MEVGWQWTGIWRMPSMHHKVDIDQQRSWRHVCQDLLRLL
jgi:hypothetical protein